MVKDNINIDDFMTDYKDLNDLLSDFDKEPNPDPNFVNTSSGNENDFDFVYSFSDNQDNNENSYDNESNIFSNNEFYDSDDDLYDDSDDYDDDDDDDDDYEDDEVKVPKKKKTKKKKKKSGKAALIVILSVLIIAAAVFCIVKYGGKKYTLSFYDQSGNLLNEIQVKSNKVAEEIPDAPELEGMKCTGWYINGDDSNCFDEESPITSDLTLVCKYKEYTRITKVEFENKKLTLVTGETYLLAAICTPEDHSEPVVYASSSSSVATVDQNGNITAISEGTAIITAQVEKLKAVCTVTVKLPDVEDISTNADSVVFNISSSSAADKSFQIKASVSPSTTNQEITYTSNRPSVATVDSNGVITPVAVGKATISLTAYRGYKKYIEVTVVKSADYIVSNKDSYSVTSTSRLSLLSELKFTPSDTESSYKTYGTISWSSSNTDIATVDEKGNVKLVKPSAEPVTITAKCTAKNNTRNVNFTVYANGGLLEIRDISDMSIYANLPDAALNDSYCVSYKNKVFFHYYENGVVDGGTGGNGDVSESSIVFKTSSSALIKNDAASRRFYAQGTLTQDTEAEVWFTYTYNEVTYTSNKITITINPAPTPGSDPVAGNPD